MRHDSSRPHITPRLGEAERLTLSSTKQEASTGSELAPLLRIAIALLEDFGHEDTSALHRTFERGRLGWESSRDDAI